ncbi:MAG: DUF6078 family protein [Prevotella sp.]|nr:DUF6078 family protein [Prevotella sp.]
MNKNFTEETFRGRQLSHAWIYCFNEHCPQHNECIRFISGKYVDDTKDAGSAVFPNACRDGRKCRLFKQARIVTFAWGFKKLFYNVRQRDAATLRLNLKAFLGSHGTYYNYANGRCKLTPEQQQGVLNIFRKKGYTENLEFDHYVEEPDFIL